MAGDKDPRTPHKHCSGSACPPPNPARTPPAQRAAPQLLLPSSCSPAPRLRRAPSPPAAAARRERRGSTGRRRGGGCSCDLIENTPPRAGILPGGRHRVLTPAAPWAQLRGARGSDPEGTELTWLPRCPSPGRPRPSGTPRTAPYLTAPSCGHTRRPSAACPGSPS